VLSAFVCSLDGKTHLSNSAKDADTRRCAGARNGIVVLCVLSGLLAFLPAAAAQNFTVTMTPFQPDAVFPGGTSGSSLSVIVSQGASFSGDVSLSCQVTSTTSGVTLPTCAVSPQSVVVPGDATATITAQNGSNAATPGTYTVTVTGTAAANNPSVQAEPITVLSVNPAFTLTVQSQVQPSSVHASNSAQGVINVNPIFGYHGTVTLSCASVTPLVVIPPICSFSPNPVPVNGTVTTSTLTISTFGPIITKSATHQKNFYALWLALPMLGLVGLGAAAGQRRTRKAWGLLALFILGASLLLLPACGTNTSTATSTPNGVTPNNTYTFTLEGIDTTGQISSNTGTTNVAPTVTLTVN